MPLNETTFTENLSFTEDEERAPLRIHTRYHIKSPPESVFGIIGDLEGITRFFPMIHHATVLRSGANASEGNTRICYIRGMGAVHENIVWWQAPKGFAYKASGKLVPLKNHLGIILLEKHKDGGTVIEWRQYFDTRYGPLGWMFPTMMRLLMGKAIANIAKILGTTNSSMNNPNDSVRN